MTLSNKLIGLACEINCFEDFKMQVDMLADYLQKLEGPELLQCSNLLKSTFKPFLENCAGRKKLKKTTTPPSPNPNIQEISLIIPNSEKDTNNPQSSYFDGEQTFADKLLSSVPEQSFLNENLFIQDESSNVALDQEKNSVYSKGNYLPKKNTRKLNEFSTSESNLAGSNKFHPCDSAFRYSSSSTYSNLSKNVNASNTTAKIVSLVNSDAGSEYNNSEIILNLCSKNKSIDEKENSVQSTSNLSAELDSLSNINSPSSFLGEKLIERPNVSNNTNSVINPTDYFTKTHLSSKEDLEIDIGNSHIRDDKHEISSSPSYILPDNSIEVVGFSQKPFLRSCDPNTVTNHSRLKNQFPDIRINYDSNEILNLKKDPVYLRKGLQHKTLSQDMEFTSHSLNFGLCSILKSVSTLDKENLLKDKDDKALNLVNKGNKEKSLYRSSGRDLTSQSMFISSVLPLNCQQAIESFNNSKEEYPVNVNLKNVTEQNAHAVCVPSLACQQSTRSVLSIKGEFPVSCRKCQFEFVDTVLWIEHEKSCSVNLSCNLCDMSLKNKYNYNKHMASHKRNVCSQCSVTFSRKKFLRAHMKNSHGICMEPESSKTFTCFHCTRAFMKRVSLYYHMQITHTLPNQKVCSKCGKVLDDEIAYKEHIKEHSENALQCQICDETFQRRQQFNHHMESHKKHVCVYCESQTSFSSKKSLFKHYQTVHPELPQRVTLNKKYHCDQCSLVFLRPSLLNDHRRTHTDEMFECRLCNVKYMRRSSLKKHFKNVHSQIAAASNADKTKLPCKHCNFSCTSMLILNKHMLNAHNVVNKHECMYCDYKVKNKQLLHKHIDSHLGKNKYMCHICGSLFGSSSTLKQHTMLLHSMERSYKCKDCDKSFKLKTSLTRHNRIHLTDRPYKCDCGSCFKRQALLNRHQANVHKKKLSPKKVRKLDSEEREEFFAREQVSSSISCAMPSNRDSRTDVEKSASDIFLAAGTASTATVIMAAGSSGDVIAENPQLFTVLDSQLIHVIPSSVQLQDGVHAVSLVNGELHNVSIASQAFHMAQGEPFIQNSTSDSFMIHQSSTNDATNLELGDIQASGGSVICNELNDIGNSQNRMSATEAESVPNKAMLLSDTQELTFSSNTLQELGNYRENNRDAHSTTTYLTQEIPNNARKENGSIF